MGLRQGYLLLLMVGLAGLATVGQFYGLREFSCQQLYELTLDAPSMAKPSDHNHHNETASSLSVRSPIVSSRMLDFPLPRVSNDYLVVIVLSRRDGYENREAIRETWAKSQTNVYFVIGQPCDIPIRYRGKDDGGNPFCKVANRPLDKAFFQETVKHREVEAELTQYLLEEQAEHHDLLMMHDIDMYRTLPAKLKFAYSFVDQYLPETVRWVLKVDDDFFVRVDAFRQYLQEDQDETYRLSPDSSPSAFAKNLLSSALGTISASSPSSQQVNGTNHTFASGQVEKLPPPPKHVILGGEIHREHYAFTNGKWKEMPQWPRGKMYPPFPLGSCGHAVTRPVVEFVAQNQFALFEYQGEDNSMGIWFDHPLAPTVKFQETQKMTNRGDCRRPNIFVVGHGVSPAKMRACDRPFKASPFRARNVS